MRAYLSNIRRAWPIPRQEAVLDEAAPGWRQGSVYRDVLPPRKRMSHGPADLKERALMLRPTRRRDGEVVHVASLSVLAWTLPDFLAVMGALVARNATLTAIAEDVTISPDAGSVIAAGAAFQAALHREEGVGPAKGGKISGERRWAEAEAKCQAIKPYWHLPNRLHPTRALCAEADVSRATAFEHLGDRRVVQREYEARLERAERNRKRRKSDAE